MMRQTTLHLRQALEPYGHPLQHFFINTIYTANTTLAQHKKRFEPCREPDSVCLVGLITVMMSKKVMK